MSWRQAAIVRGAALRGLEGITPRMKRARRHYGFKLGKRFREGQDPKDSAYLDDFDIKYCGTRIQWTIAKAGFKHVYGNFQHADSCDQGEKVFSDTFKTTHVETDYTRGQALHSTISLYSCALNDPPEYITDPRKS
jgi:hypothetical protein